MKKIIALFLLLTVVVFTFGCNNDVVDDTLPEEMPDDFYFTLSWGAFGRSSYDSKTGKLVKDSYVYDVDNFSTTYYLSDYEMKYIYDMIRDLHLEQYPDEFDDNDFITSDPYLTYSLSVEGGGFYKTVKANEVGIAYLEDSAGKTKKAKDYLKTIDEIVNILTRTDEWNELSDWIDYD
ncbi:MAG: hypothetical protein IKA02_01630 [Clostridia bacterium]|nr:hypothetical protein [Clostridia bacterium]